MNSETIQKQNVEEEQQENIEETQQSKQPQESPVIQHVEEKTRSREGFNLIPALSKEEKIKIKKKDTFNFGSLLSIILLASMAIGIVGFNIISKMHLNSRKSALSTIERKVNEDIDKLSTNNAILDRVKIYEKFKKGSFSHKNIIEYLKDIAAVERANKRGKIMYSSIEITEDLTYKVSGSAPSLEQIAYLWYLFGIDENIDEINLKSVSKSDIDTRFSFEGKLNKVYFSNE